MLYQVHLINAHNVRTVHHVKMQQQQRQKQQRIPMLIMATTKSDNNQRNSTIFMIVAICYHQIRSIRGLKIVETECTGGLGVLMSLTSYPYNSRADHTGFSPTKHREVLGESFTGI